MEVFNADTVALIRGLRRNAKPVEREGVWASVVDDLPAVVWSPRKRRWVRAG